jgi:hypothetical protein
MADYINPWQMVQSYFSPVTDQISGGVNAGAHLAQLPANIEHLNAMSNLYGAHADLFKEQALQRAKMRDAVNEWINLHGGISPEADAEAMAGNLPGAIKEFKDSQDKQTVMKIMQEAETPPAPVAAPSISAMPTGNQFIQSLNQPRPDVSPMAFPQGKNVQQPIVADQTPAQAQPQKMSAGDIARKVLAQTGNAPLADKILEWDQKRAGKTEPKGYETMEEALAEAQRVLSKTDKNAGLVATAELGAGNKWVPKLVSNITLRIPPMTGDTNLPPNVFRDRRTGKLEEYVPETNTTRPYNPTGGIPSAALDWQGMKKSAAVINGPVFKRMIDNAEILAKGVTDPKTGKTYKPELDQVVDLRNKVDDKLFSKINNDLQAFNNWDQWLAYKTSDIPMTKLISKVMADVDTLATVYSGGGNVTSDFKMKFAKDLFETGLSKEAFAAKMDTHKQSVLERAIKYSQPNPAGMAGVIPATNPAPAETTDNWKDYLPK